MIYDSKSNEQAKKATRSWGGWRSPCRTSCLRCWKKIWKKIWKNEYIHIYKMKKYVKQMNRRKRRHFHGAGGVLYIIYYLPYTIYHILYTIYYILYTTVSLVIYTTKSKWYMIVQQMNRRKKKTGEKGDAFMGRVEVPLSDVLSAMSLQVYSCIFFFQYNYSGFISVLCFFNIMYLFFSM